MANLPTGTVTFLFTDIESSTKLWEQHPAEMKVALARHNAIVRREIESEGGYVFKTVGDEFCAAFSGAPNAIAACIKAQRSLRTEDWAEAQIKVRMGMHSGIADERDGDYFGTTVNRVARVMSIAVGEQILLSAATAELLRGILPDGTSLRDMGEHRLKGLLNPEHLWQVVAPDLPADFPPLRSLNSIPNNLPIQITSFVGREHELSELQRLLPTTRLLTLTGAGGSGKTRLSLQVASEVLDTFKDGAWLFELAPLSDPALVPVIIASVLGVRAEPDRPLMATLLDWLRPKQLLLILDNCEHLIDACAKFADAVLHASHEARILATSREALGISGELAWRVPSLPTPGPSEAVNLTQLEQYAAVQLFVERASFALPTFAVTIANAPAIVKICYRLDGIPLAIELAAARVKALHVEQIAERLDDRFRLLTGGSRTALPRQQTLRSLVDWSHSLLPELEQVLLRRLSVFAGGWTLGAAEVICSGADLESIDVLDLLTHLVDKSLVVPDEQASEPRYQMLETIRQYAREKLLDAGESQWLRDQHLTFFLRQAEHSEPILFTSKRAEWIPRLDLELDNMRASLEWACERDPEAARWMAGQLRWFWQFGDHLNEGNAWYGRVLVLSKRVDATINKGMALALLGAGMVSAYLGAYDESHRILEESVVLWQELSDKPRLAEALLQLAFAMLRQGQSDEARGIFDANESIIRQFAEPMILAFALNTWGRALDNAPGDYAAAKTLLDESLTVGRKLNDPVVLSLAFASLGNWALKQGDYEAARRYLMEALASSQRIGWKYLIAAALTFLADVMCLQGDYPQAHAWYDEVLAMDRAIGSQTHVAYDLARMGYVAIHQGDLEQSAALFGQSLGIYREQSYLYGMAIGLAGYAELRRVQGRLVDAVRLLARASSVPAFHSSPIPVDRIEYDRSVAAARAQMDEASFNAAWEAGCGLPLEQAIELALAKG